MDESVKARLCTVMGEVLARSHLVQPDEVAGDVRAALAPVGLGATVYLVDLPQRTLRALPAPGVATPDERDVDRSVPGRVFTMVTSAHDGPRDLWVPLFNGTERLGVVHFTLPPRADAGDDDWRRHCERIAGMVGHLVAAKTAHGDSLHRARRSAPVSPAGELVLQMVPELTSSHRRLALSAITYPQDDPQGVAYDYAVDGSVAHVALLHAAGTGLGAALRCAVVLSAVRASRRAGGDLRAQATAADAALTEAFPQAEGSRCVAALLARLDLDTGLWCHVNASHPQPLLLRGSRLVLPLVHGRRLPLGARAPEEVPAALLRFSGGSRDIAPTTFTEPSEEKLRPLDRILLHNGLVAADVGEADPRLTVGRLVALTEECEEAGLPAPETLRRLTRAVAAHGGPHGAGGALLLEWSAEAARRTVPGHAEASPAAVAAAP
ncbi:MAG TPA: SpoIIE family protein phosphatase [Pilimelia sp.]|nr:SpoIIE family protein phosphatase [Pilimelia sp.]